MNTTMKQKSNGAILGLYEYICMCLCVRRDRERERNNRCTFSHIYKVCNDSKIEDNRKE